MTDILHTCCFCSALLSRLEWLIWQNGIVRCILSFSIGLLNANRHGAELAGDFWVTALSAMGIFSTLPAMWALNVYSHVVAVSARTYARTHTMRVQAPLEMYRAQLQFRLVQVITVLMNVQGNVFILLSSVNVLQCSHNMNPFTFARRKLFIVGCCAGAQLVCSFFADLNYFCLICEMLLVSVCVCMCLRRKYNALLRGESKGGWAKFKCTHVGALLCAGDEDTSSLDGHSVESDIVVTVVTQAPDICVVSATPPPAYTHA